MQNSDSGTCLLLGLSSSNLEDSAKAIPFKLTKTFSPNSKSVVARLQTYGTQRFWYDPLMLESSELPDFKTVDMLKLHFV